MEISKPLRHKTIWTNSPTQGYLKKYVWKIKKTPKLPEIETATAITKTKQTSCSSTAFTVHEKLHIYPRPVPVINQQGYILEIYHLTTSLFY